MIWQARSTASGASSADFTTTALPATIAGAILSAISNIGTFHGMIAPTTPSGSRYRHGQHVGPERYGFALQFRAEAAEEDKDVGQHRGLDPAFGAQRLAGFERDEPGQFLDMPVEQTPAFGDKLAALARRQFRPCLLRAAGGFHRGIHVGRVAFRGLADDRARCRIDVRKRSSVARRHHRAVDQ